MSEPARATDATDDAVLGGAVRLRQPAAGFRVGIDSVLLAAATPVEDGERVFEPGAGVGAAALCLARRVSGARIVGIEADRAMVRLANENVQANGLLDRVEIMAGDVAAPLPPRVALPFDHCMMNPPFLDAGRSQAPPDAARAAAQVEGAGGLAPWIACASAVLRHKGTLTLVHRADRLDALFAALHPAFGGIMVFPLWPRDGAAARRILLRARRGVRAPPMLAAGMVLHRADGSFTREADAALRGAAIEF